MLNYSNNDYYKERITSSFLSSYSFLSSWIWVDDLESQKAGIDVSCHNNNKDYYLDLKLKNSGYTNVPDKPSRRWSVEIYRLRNNKYIQGWMVSDISKTNIIGFEEAFGNTFNSLDYIDLYLFSKNKLKNVIQDSTNLSLAEITNKAKYMLEYDVKYIKLNDQFCLSRTGRDINNLTINLCFDRDIIEKLSKKVTFKKAA